MSLGLIAATKCVSSGPHRSGTGKTTWMTGAVRSTVKHRQSSRVVVASFTKAAASVIAGRGLPVDRGQVGTLHALAYRAIERPLIATELYDDWNQRNPALALSGGVRNSQIEEAPAERMGSTDGDRLMGELEILRNRMRPQSVWPMRVRMFHQRWEAWKQEAGCVDFTDLIELAAANTEEAPGRPLVGFFDEAQDFTPLQLSLVRHWGKRMDRVILAGDDDQTLYRFAGATPDAFLDPPLPDEQKRLLSQSYRVPRAVHRAADAWVKHLTRREPKEYLPRDEEGVARLGSASFRDGVQLAREVAKIADEGRSVVVLAACSYMLDPVKHAMRSAGVAFHAPLRRSRGDWNPLSASRGSSGADKIVAYMIMDEEIFGEASRLWTGGDVKRWSSVVKKRGVFVQNAARVIADLPERELTYGEVASLFASEADLERAVTPDLAWLSENVLAGAKKSLDYPLRVAKRSGVRSLLDEPRVSIGTIHSYKGGEGDVVVLDPSLSLAGYREWSEAGEPRDSIIRQFYVGMTRAKEELVVCSPSGPISLDPADLLKGAKVRRK